MKRPPFLILVSIYCQITYSTASCSRKCIASDEIDKVLGQLLYKSDSSELSWDDKFIRSDNGIVNSSNGTSSNSEESVRQSITRKM